VPHDVQRILLGFAGTPHPLNKLNHFMMPGTTILLWHDRNSLEWRALYDMHRADKRGVTTGRPFREHIFIRTILYYKIRP
jgi:hypothetical protein